MPFILALVLTCNDVVARRVGSSLRAALSGESVNGTTTSKRSL
jgi:hypothetical protein